MNSKIKFEKVLEKFRKKSGQGYVCLQNMDGRLLFVGNGYSEQPSEYNVVLLTADGKAESIKDKNFTFILKNEWKFGLRVDSEFLFCGNGEEKMEKYKGLLVYTRTENMVFLFYFDVTRGIFPILDYDFDVEDMRVEPMLLENYAEKNVDAVSNLYHLVMCNYQ